MVSPSPLSTVEEISEVFHFEEAEATKMLEETVNKRVSGGVLQAAAALRQDNTEEASSELTRVLKFAELLPGTVAKPRAVTDGEKNELYMLYQASQLTEGAATPESAAKLELLKDVLAVGGA